MVLYKKLVPSIFFRSIPSRSLLSFSRISILFLSSSQSEVWTVDRFERYRVDKKNWVFSLLSYTQPFKRKKVTRKKNKGTLTVPFVADDIPPEHKFPGLDPQMLSVLNKYMFLVQQQLGTYQILTRDAGGKGQLCRRIQYQT